MKKNVLALSIAAALIGLTGGAHAMSALSELQGATADSLMVNNAGVGHMLIVPYFTTQGKNNTLINIVNTDTIGKVVKVRFRGAANSDDLLDFQVFLSPKDVWTARVYQNAAGISQIETTDNSCTKPNRADLNKALFSVLRLDPVMTNPSKQANGTREGYVEIFNVADIKPVSKLATAITHVKGVPPGCSFTDSTGHAAWTALDDLNSAFTYAGALAKDLQPPTTGLMANWTIIDVTDAATWSGTATAIQAVSTAATNSRATGNIIYWPQTNELLSAADLLGGFSSDPIMVNAVASAAATNLSWYTLDLPDFSTPYIRQSSVAPVVNTPVSANVQADWLMWAISSTSGTSEFWTEKDANGAGPGNDWVFSMPTRRYAVAYDYAAGKIRTTTNNYFSESFNIKAISDADSLGNGRMICVQSADMTYAPVNREEAIPGTTGNTVIVSPVKPGFAPDKFAVCGEVAVMSINNGVPTVGSSSGALKGSVTLQNVSTEKIDAADAQKYGWMQIATPGRVVAASGTVPAYQSGIPLLGGSFVRAKAGTNGFGAFHTHRFIRPLVFQSRD
jgi:hypothetical protein